MQVLKFGGTSVANAINIQKVISIVSETAKKDQTIVVVSALGGVTDLLLDAGNLAAEGNTTYLEKLNIIEQRHRDTAAEMIMGAEAAHMMELVLMSIQEIRMLCEGIFMLGELTMRSKDRLASYGEKLSSIIIAGAFQDKGYPAVWKDSRELIQTNSAFTAAAVDFPVTNEKIKAYFNTSKHSIYILPGFIAADAKGATTTLGRGGSDYTAAIYAAALDVENLEIWTDVSGMMTSDPRITANAKIIPHISYLEAMELSHFGAKVIYPPTIQPVMKKGIPVWIKNTFAPQDYGTMISDRLNHEQPGGDMIRGISSINNIALITLEGSGMVGIPGFSKRLFEALSNEQINVILITQSSSEHSISVGIDRNALAKAVRAVDATFVNEIALQKVDPLKVEEDLSIVAVVGENMRHHSGVSGRMFSAMGRNGVNVRAIAQGSSEKNISAVISTADVKKCINVLHEEFFGTSFKQVNVFLAGVGNVGSKLLVQLHAQTQYLEKHLKLQVKLAGVMNSKKMHIDENGIDLSDWQRILGDGSKADMYTFTETIIQKNLRNSIFVDVTANADVASLYDVFLRKSISVVACNKIAASSAYDRYQQLKDLAREFNTSFLFETNVGAGLPIIGTIHDLVRSGDRIHKMQAVLSGTLNFVFNNYDGSRPFADVVKQAQEEGYTEPDPRLDLGGTDVMRKILILSREAGQIMEIEQIENKSFMPEACMQGSVEDFYRSMKEHEDHFAGLLHAAKKEGAILKFVASYENGKASVGLQHIPPQHDLYHLYGKDNVVLFYTDRYQAQPLVIKGAGAGADVTASGVFADILRSTK
jgi:aspartokinase/homoserine dehydrogenase 1